MFRRNDPIEKAKDLMQTNPELPVLTAARFAGTTIQYEFTSDTFKPDVWGDAVEDCEGAEVARFPDGGMLLRREGSNIQEKRQCLKRMYADLPADRMTDTDIATLWDGLPWRTVIVVWVHPKGGVL